MTELEATDILRKEIHAAISRSGTKSVITFVQVLGVLEVVKQDIFAMLLQKDFKSENETGSN